MLSAPHLTIRKKLNQLYSLHIDFKMSLLQNLLLLRNLSSGLFPLRTMDDELEVSLLSQMEEEEEDMVYVRYERRERRRYKSDNER